MSYHQQVLYLSDSTGAPSELFNAARLSRNLVAANLCGATFDNVIDNGGCDGLLYQPIAPAGLADPVLWLDAADGSLTQQMVPNRGSGGPLLDGVLGATIAASTDDPKWLGGAEPYLYTPGLTGNTASVPDAANLRITGDIEILLRVAADVWASGSNRALLSKYVSATEGYEIQLDSASGISFIARLAASDISVSFASAFLALTDGQATWLKISRVASTGVISLYKAPESDSIPGSWALVSSQTGTSGNMTGGSTSALYFGARAGTTNPYPGKSFRAVIRTSIGVASSAVLDVDFSTNTAQSSFVASTAQTVTINRASSGRKTVAYVGRPLWLFGSDDVITISDTGDLLDFAASESFTVMTVSRRHGTPAAVQAIIAKKNTSATGTAGWWISDQVAGGTTAQISDGSTAPSATSAAKTTGQVYSHVLARSATAPTVSITQNGTAVSAAGISTSIANAIPALIGSLGDGSLDFDGEILAVLAWRRLLTTAEITAVSTFLTNAAAATGTCWTAVDFSATAAPWYDGSTASTEALGFWIEEWTGLDGAHHTRAMAGTGQNRGGSRFGPQSSNARIMKMNVLLHGTTERGLEYLFRWLEQILIDACDPCGARTAWWREFCPSAPVTSPEEGYVRAEKIALLEGPTWESPPADNAGCALRRVSLTLAAGDPCLYRESTPLVTQESTTLTDVYSSSLAVATCGSWYTFGSSMHTQVEIPAASYGRSAPVILITSPFEPAALPALRIAGYSDPNDTSDPCRSRLLGELILEGSDTAGKDIEIDMAQRRVRFRDRYAGGDWEDGSRYIAAAVNSGLRRWWSFDGCANGFVVVEPVYAGLATNRYVPATTRVSSWTVRVSSGARVGCA